MSEESDTNWQVITGGPCCGKSSTIRKLASNGYRIIPESARIHIDGEISRGRDKDEIYSDPDFQSEIIRLDRDMEERFPSDELVFMDRSLADSAAYMRYFYEGCEDEIGDVLEEVEGRYDNVFVLEQLPYSADYARREDEDEAREMHEELKRVYREAGYNPVEIPVLSIDERVERIYDHIPDEKL